MTRCNAKEITHSGEPSKIITNSAVALSAMDHFSIIQLFVLVSSRSFNVLVHSQSSLQPC